MSGVDASFVLLLRTWRAKCGHVVVFVSKYNLRNFIANYYKFGATDVWLRFVSVEKRRR